MSKKDRFYLWENCVFNLNFHTIFKSFLYLLENLLKKESDTLENKDEIESIYFQNNCSDFKYNKDRKIKSLNLKSNDINVLNRLEKDTKEITFIDPVSESLIKRRISRKDLLIVKTNNNDERNETVVNNFQIAKVTGSIKQLKTGRLFSSNYYKLIFF